MSGFNMPPGVSPNDIPGNEPDEDEDEEEDKDWEWIGHDVSRMFRITEEMAKECQRQMGGKARRMDDPDSCATEARRLHQDALARKEKERLAAARWLVENEDEYGQEDYVRHYATVFLGRTPTAEDWDTIGDMVHDALEIPRRERP